MADPLVSVIIPAYNQGRFIAEAMQSVFDQEYPQDAIEVIVIDDGSTDDTKKIVQSFLCHQSPVSSHQLEMHQKQPVTRCRGDLVRYIPQRNQGKAMAVKTGIEATRGKYIFNLDADDVFLPGKIRKAVEVFESDPAIAYVSHPVVYWDERQNTRKPERFPPFLRGKVNGKDLLRFFYRTNKIHGCGSSFAARKTIFDTMSIRSVLGPFVDGYMVLFSASAGNGYFLPEPLSLYRVHAEQHSVQKGLTRLRQDVAYNEAILAEVLKGDFGEDVRLLQTLKTKVAQLKEKEALGTKKFSDITALWSFVLKNRKKFGVNLLELIKNYKLIQRSILL